MAYSQHAQFSYVRSVHHQKAYRRMTCLRACRRNGVSQRGTPGLAARKGFDTPVSLSGERVRAHRRQSATSRLR